MLAIAGCGGEENGAANFHDFLDLGDSTVRDIRTGLIWQQNDDGKKRIWRHATQYCGELDLAASTEWRLPEREDLRTLVDLAHFNPAVNPAFFPSTRPDPYWTSTRFEEYEGYSWFVHFGDGSEHYGSRTSTYLTRCVR